MGVGLEGLFRQVKHGIKLYDTLLDLMEGTAAVSADHLAHGKKWK